MNGFSDVIGHARIVNGLKNAITAGKVSHAYIFSGLSGSGKSLIAGSFAKVLQCEHIAENSAVDACGLCVSCRVFENGNHPDVFYVSSKGKSLGVEDVREQIIKQMEIAPYKYRYKIFIIDRAHTMTVQAQNALLKTIEEPAGYGIFLLLAEGLNFLPTVLSRCICYKLEPLGYSEVYGYLTAEGINEEMARLAAVYAQGNIGRGLKLAKDEEFINMRLKVLGVVKRLPSAELPDVFTLAKELDAFKERIQEALDIMYLWYRDMLVLRSADQRFVIQSDEEIAAGGEVFVGLTAVWDAKRRLRHYTNFQLTIEMMLLDIWSAVQKIDGVRQTTGARLEAERRNA